MKKISIVACVGLAVLTFVAFSNVALGQTTKTRHSMKKVPKNYLATGEDITPIENSQEEANQACSLGNNETKLLKPNEITNTSIRAVLSPTFEQHPTLDVIKLKTEACQYEVMINSRAEALTLYKILVNNDFEEIELAIGDNSRPCFMYERDNARFPVCYTDVRSITGKRQ